MSKTKIMIVSRSCTKHPQSPPLTIDGTVLKGSDDLVLLRVTFDSKMTFEKHLHSVYIAASQRLGILTKSWQVFHDRSLLGRCSLCFVQPVLEYCSAVWCSAADTHLKLLDLAVSGAQFLTWGVFECDIIHCNTGNTTSIITVELFVTTARLARGQTLFIRVKIGDRRVKICSDCENSSRGENSICYLILCKKILFIK